MSAAPGQRERALVRATAELMRVRGVVSVGLGLDQDGREAIVVGVARASAKLRTALPEHIDGVRVLLREVGEVETQEGGADHSTPSSAARAVRTLSAHRIHERRDPLDGRVRRYR